MAIRITGMNSGLDTDSMVQELVNAYEKQGEKYTKKKTKMEWKDEAWTELNSKIKSFVSKNLSNMRFSGNYNKKKTTASDSSKVSVVASDNAVCGTQKIRVKKLASAAYLTGDTMSLKEGLTGKVTGNTKLSELGFSGENKKVTITKGKEGATTSIDIDVSEDMTVDRFVKTLAAAGVDASFDSATGRIFVSSKSSGDACDFNLTGDAGALDALGLGSAASKVDGEDAVIELNGATFKSDTNTFNINNLTITAKEETGDNYVSLSTENDYDEIYDNIKNFFKEYNSLMKQMETLYNAESADDYEPLTSEEKEAMTDDEIEKWEGKIKSALLRNDENLSSVINTLKTSMLETYDIGGTKMSLSSFGINTLPYLEAADNEKSLYHINGDPDDESTSAEKDKLKSLIATDPEKVSEFFQKLTTDIYDKMSKLSRSNSYRSYGNFYDDKKLANDLRDTEKKVSDWEDKVAKYEEKYYRQFSAMESAMGTLNSQQTYISQLMG